MIFGAMPVSRETSERLALFARELRRWQPAVNLVSARSLPELERRHIADSLQLAELAPEGSRWVDLGSGGGLPGLVVAASDSRPRVILIESDSRKCAFLRHAASAMGLAVEVREDRIEAAIPALDGTVGIVSARALAPLDKLLAYAQPLLAAGAVGLFPKGKSYASELTEARHNWHFDVDSIVSRTDPDGRILRIGGFWGRRGQGGPASPGTDA